jgi:hypothetical protein
MKKNLILFLLGICLLEFLAGNVYAQQKTQTPQSIAVFNSYIQCRAHVGDDACLGFAERNGASVFSEPNATSRIINRYPASIYIFLTSNEESAQFPGWIPTVGFSNNQYVSGWARHTDIVLITDLRRVTDCWPIEIISWEEDEEVEVAGGKFQLKFDTAGKLLSSVVNGRANDLFAKSYAAYYARGVFLIRPHTDANLEGLVPIFMLNHANKKLTISAPAKKPSSRFFPDKILDGCRDIPKVDLDAPMKFKQARK